MSAPREPFDWSGSGDEPIPLDARSLESPRSDGSESVLVEAEEVVRSAQEAIARQDTDPSNALQPSLESRVRLAATRSLSLRTLALLLTMSCGLAFAHGWTTGAKGRPRPQPHLCDAGHCQPRGRQ